MSSKKGTTSEYLGHQKKMNALKKASNDRQAKHELEHPRSWTAKLELLRDSHESQHMVSKSQLQLHEAMIAFIEEHYNKEVALHCGKY